MSALFPKRDLIAALLVLFLVPACTLPGRGSDTPTPESTALSQSTPMPGAPRTLTVCLGEEPNTLYPFSSMNAAARSVLAAIDDGPIDTVGYDYQPVILQKLPGLSEGDASFSKVDVTAGSRVVDAEGNLTALAAGTRVRPAGCRADGCVIQYDGSSPLQMDQIIATFRLRPDLTWSDGTPLTAEDSVYAFQLAADKDTPGSRFLIDRTQTYEAADPTTLQWWGVPGFIDSTFFTNFWPPAPKHIWGQFRAAELPQVDVAARLPIGWGPYRIQEWIAGDHITLAKNPHYFRADEGYPKFDQLVFRFISDADTAVSELTGGGCDILDPSIHLDSQAALLEQLNRTGQAQTFLSPAMTIEWLGLGIVPAAYDDGFNPGRDRPDVLGDVRTRQAIALCLDRQKVIDIVFFGRTSVPGAFLPPDHPLQFAGVPSYRFDPAAGSKLLEEAGWRDLDGEISTPRQSVGMKNIPAGTKLMLNYYTTQTAQRRQVAEILSQSLEQCGIGTNIEYFSQTGLYAPGPAGVLFGRQFDLIEFGMSSNSFEAPCDWFTGSEIPNAGNHWAGTNISGYRNPEYDAACRAAHLSLPGEQAYLDAHHRAQAIFASGLPAIPLYYRLRIAAARPDLCHVDFDATANPLWNLEAIAAGQDCQ